jgi:hypothetical protein
MSGTGKPDRAWDLAFVSTRSSSAALNDDFVDIGDFQKLAPNCVKAGSAEHSRRQAVDVNAVQVQDAPDDRNTRHEVQDPDRSRDDDVSDRMVGIDHIHGNLVDRPH